MPQPDPNDNVLDAVIETDPSQGDEEMPVPSALHEQNLGRLAGAGASAHEHFVTFGKVLDYAYESDRKMVSLVEALGVRESASRSGHLGMPQAGAGPAGQNPAG